MRKFLLLALTLFITVAYALTSSSHKNVVPVANAKDTFVLPAQINKYKFGDYLIVTTKNTYVRKGAGADYGVVQSIKKNGLLKFLSSNGSWHKVIVVGTDRLGYVHYRNVK